MTFNLFFFLKKSHFLRNTKNEAYSYLEKTNSLLKELIKIVEKNDVDHIFYDFYFD
jgi:hypothetical protein